MNVRRSAAAVVVAAVLAFAATAGALLLGGAGGGRSGEAAPAADASPLPRGASTAVRISRLVATVEANPASVPALTALAAAYLQQARETLDPGAYDRADAALRLALALSPRDPGALTERGALKLARHDFAGALRDARAARAAAPEVVKPFGVLVDALVELGRYGEAARVLQEMVDRKPTLDAYARVSYLRELRGDLPGAASALRLAVSAGGDVPENTAFAQSLLGDLALMRGRPREARAAYGAALRLVPGHAPSVFGLARADVAAGDPAAAVRRLRPLVARLPVPAYTVALGEAELALGRRPAAQRDLAVVGAQERLLRSAGVNTDVDLALFEADHGSPRRAVAIAHRAWAAAPSVRSADALGWALVRAGRPAEGLTWARRALKLGSRDPLFLFHAGTAAARAGETARARRWLAEVVQRAPRFSALHGPQARRELARVEAAA